VKRDQRLRSPADFRRVRETAPRAWPHRLLVLYVIQNELGRTRVGITVSSRVGNAVVRNRVLSAGLDVLLIARPASASAAWPELCAALDSMLARSGATPRAPAAVQAGRQHA
jgi:ribonuclease P protein component